MATARPKNETVGFGFDPSGGAYHFVLTVPADEDGSVTVAEHFVYGESLEEAAARYRFSDVPKDFVARKPIMKVDIDVARWQRVAEEVRTEFNRRLLGKRLKKSSWKIGENSLSSHLGKEVILLLWAIEQANPADIPNALANWQGLAPEERWWLYTTINAATGHVSEGRGRGWRRAIQIAFTENPVTEGQSYYDRNSSPALPQKPSKAKRGKSKQNSQDDSQTTLLDLSPETTEL